MIGDAIASKKEIANIRLNTAFPKEGVFIAGQDKVFIAKDEVFIEEGHLSQLSEILTTLKSIISQRENWRTNEKNVGTEDNADDNKAEGIQSRTTEEPGETKVHGKSHARYIRV